MKHASLPQHVRKELILWLSTSIFLIVLLSIFLSAVSIKMQKHYRALYEMHAKIIVSDPAREQKNLKTYNRILAYQQKQQKILETLNELPQLLPLDARIARLNYHYKQPLQITIESRSRQSLKRALALLSMRYICLIKEVIDSKSFQIVCEIAP